MLATGEVKCVDEEIPFEIPQEWEWCRFSSLYLSLTDGTHSTPKYTLSGIPFISVKDKSSGVIDFLIDAIPKKEICCCQKLELQEYLPWLQQIESLVFL